MDAEFQHRLVTEAFSRLVARIEADHAFDVAIDWQERSLFARMYGPLGVSQPYQVKIEPWLYPVGPWRVGFIDPDVAGADRLSVPDRDPRFWPYSQLPGTFGGFHVHFEREHRVFVCRPFTTEYFRYHGDEPWDPHTYDLYGVVTNLREAVKKAVHFSIWCPINYRAAQ
jgi:hypothetical protein